MSWTTVLLLSGGAYLFKAAGLLSLSGREVPAPALRLISLLPPTLLSALVVVQVVGGPDGAVALDARFAGILAAGVAVWARAPFLVVVLVGAATAALLRALTG